MNFDLSELDQKLAQANCPAAGRTHWFDEIASTNDFIAEHPDAHGRVCLAGLQTAGRGRRGKQWHAPAMSSVLMSIGWQLPSANIAGLSLVCGLAVRQALDKLGVSCVSLKWPNDVLLDGKKLGGVLVEISGQRLVVGVGINNNMGAANENTQFPKDTRLPWTDLTRQGYRIGFTELAVQLITDFYQTLEIYTREGFQAFRSNWVGAHYFQGKQVILEGAECIHGTVTGVDDLGGLELEVEGTPRVFYSGEVSMKPAMEIR